MRRPLLDVRDDDEGQQTTGGTPRTVKMAQERDDLVYLAKLAEQAERFDEMARRRRGGIITPFVYSSGRRRIDKGGAARERRGPRRVREPTPKRISGSNPPGIAPAVAYVHRIG